VERLLCLAATVRVFKLEVHEALAVLVHVDVHHPSVLGALVPHVLGDLHPPLLRRLTQGVEQILEQHAGRGDGGARAQNALGVGASMGGCHDTASAPWGRGGRRGRGRLEEEKQAEWAGEQTGLGTLEPTVPPLGPHCAPTGSIASITRRFKIRLGLHKQARQGDVELLQRWIHQPHG